mgnify:FL=1
MRLLTKYDGAEDIMLAASLFDRTPTRMRKSILSVLIVTVLLATIAIFIASNRYFTRQETQAASSQMAFYLRELNDVLGQHQHLPFVLARNPLYFDDLNPNDASARINGQLSQLAQEAGLEAIYAMDANGLVLAASNAGLPNSFLGQNYNFRPYFQEALAGNRSDYFAIGATSGRPGYFVAEPATLASGTKRGTQQGVIAIKLDVSELQRSWESDSEVVVAVNDDGIVVLASNPAWLYRPLGDLSSATRERILDSRQFGDEPLMPLGWSTNNGDRAVFDGQDFIVAQGAADWRGWTVLYLQPQSGITRQTLVATGVFGSFIALLIGFATFLRSLRIETAYATSERQREALVETNQRLEQAQSELARSAKLAALGHLAASVTHELGQPISAFRNHLAAAEISGEITSRKTANSLKKLVDRMEAITLQFRYFARGKPDRKTRVLLSGVLNEATNLLRSEIDAAGIGFCITQPPRDVFVRGNKIQLEQVITNVLKNAVHAVTQTAQPKIDIDVETQSSVVKIRVTDNGPGLGGASLKELQEPFFSTKPSGVGMGLGLAITTEILRDHHGELTVEPSETGVIFVVILPIEETDP